MNIFANEVGPHEFWMRVCGIDTHRRGSNYAQHDTPWNAYTFDDVLVCTLWADRIITVFDDKEARARRFVRIGGKAHRWRGPAIQHGRDANENLIRAARERLRVVGFEAEPNDVSGRRQIKHFYLNRQNELQRVFDFSHAEMLERLRVHELFTQQDAATNEVWIEPGYLFELVVSRGSVAGGRESVGSENIHVTDERALLGDSDDFVSGNSSNEHYAWASIPLLVEHVLLQKDQTLETLTYEEVAHLLGRKNKHGLPAPLGLGSILGRAMDLIDQATQNWDFVVPYLTTVVVAKAGVDMGLPGVGVRERWTDYGLLSRSEKRAKMLAEHLKIVQFGSRWNDVLDALGLPRIAVSDSLGTDKANGGGWGAGESQAHKALKAYVRANPAMFGVPATAESFEEYALRSGDEIDVFFRLPDMWIGVEVKSSVSSGNELDLQRGLYQVIKYRAVLEAQAKADCLNPPPIVKVFLVLECSMSTELLKTAAMLGVEVTQVFLTQ